MARLIASENAAGAHAAKNRATGFTLVLALPCAVAFLIVPDLIMCALFARAALTGLFAAYPHWRDETLLAPLASRLWGALLAIMRLLRVRLARRWAGSAVA